jgi:hypothetical protein
MMMMMKRDDEEEAVVLVPALFGDIMVAVVAAALDSEEEEAPVVSCSIFMLRFVLFGDMSSLLTIAFDDEEVDDEFGSAFIVSVVS